MSLFRHFAAALLCAGMCATHTHAQNPKWMEAPALADGSTVQGLSSDLKFQDAVMDSEGRIYAIFNMNGDATFLGTTIPYPANTILPAADFGIPHAVAVVCFDGEGTMLWHTSMGSNYRLGKDHLLLDDDEQPMLIVGTGSFWGFETPEMQLTFPDTTLVLPLTGSGGRRREPVLRLNATDGSFSARLFTREDYDPDEAGRPIYRYGKFFLPTYDRQVFRYDAEGNLEMRYTLEAWPPGTVIRDFEVLADTSVVIYGHTNTTQIGLRTLSNPINVFADPAPSGLSYSLWAARASAAGEVLWIRAYCQTDGTDTQRGAEQVRLLPDGNLLLTALHVEPTTFAGVTYGIANQSMTKFLLLRIDADGNEVSGLQLANDMAVPGGFVNNVGGRDKSWVVPEADGSIQFAHEVQGTVGLNGFTPPGLGAASYSVIMVKISPTGVVVAADHVENAKQNPRLLVHGSRTILLANYGGGSQNVFRTRCLPFVPASNSPDLHNSVVLAIEHSEPKPLPVAQFELQYLDQEGGFVRFNNTSINATTNTWVYGDNSPNSTLPSPVKGYNGGQNYLACLTAANLCGSSQACDNVVLGAAYTAHPPSAVQNSTVQLHISDLARAITAGTTFKLVRNGAADIPFTNLQFSTAPAGTSGGNHPFHTWSGACDLTDAPLGPWGVVIARPGHAADTLHAAFTVLPNTGAGLMVLQTGLSSRASVFNMEGRREYRSAGGEVLRGGRAAHEDGYLIAGTGEAPVGVPVISMLTHAANLTRFYERGYTTMRPTHASYADLGQWREDNDFELPYNEGRDYVVSDNKAVRFHFLPQGGSSYQVKTRFAPGFGPGHQANLLWRNETYALQPVFGSDVLAGGNSIRSMIGLGQYLRLAAQDVLGMAVGTPGCHPCFTQAEEQVMAIYATDIANLPPVDPRFSLGQDPKIYDLRDVTADVLAQSMRTSCAPQLSTTTVDGITFQRIVDRALERLLLFGSQNPCLPPTEPPVPDGYNGSLLGNPRPPVYQPPLIRVGSSYNGPVFGAIPVSNPVATPPVPDLPETFWAPFEGVSTGEGTVIGTATIEVDGEKMTAPVQIKVEDDCTVTFTCFPPPPAGDKLEFEGENGHVSADAGPSLLGAYIDPDDDYALAQVVFLLELLPDENPHYAAALVAVFCMGDLRHPETTVGMNAQQVSDKWDQCLRDFHDAVNAANAPYAPGLQDMSPDIGPNVGQG